MPTCAEWSTQTLTMKGSAISCIRFVLRTVARVQQSIDRVQQSIDRVQHSIDECNTRQPECNTLQPECNTRSSSIKAQQHSLINNFTNTSLLFLKCKFIFLCDLINYVYDIKRISPCRISNTSLLRCYVLSGTCTQQE